MDLETSLQKILDAPEIVCLRFYDIFLGSYPEFRPFFETVNLTRQAVLLTMALTLVKQYRDHPYVATELYLQYLGSKHHAWGIPIDSYPKFCGALLTTLREFHGEQWSDALAAEWSTALENATEVMLEGYESHFKL